MSMVWIAGQTLSSTGAVTFSGIPQTFTHLQIRLTGRILYADTANQVYVQINGDASTSNYRSHILYGDGFGGLSFDYGTGRGYGIQGFLTATNALANTFGVNVIDILDYSNSNKNKVLRSLSGIESNSSTGPIAAVVSTLYISTNQITQILLSGLNGNFIAGTRVDLYGITSSQVTGA